MVASTFMPGRKTRLRIIGWLDENLDGNALDHLDEIAGGILRRKQSLTGTGGASDGIDDTFEILAIGIDANDGLFGRERLWRVGFP